jgi:Zn ribbon nucleic-acid-binding protein
MPIFKILIAPIQQRILAKNMCPACTRKLDKAKQREPLTNETEVVTCECGRKFVYLRPQRKYKRATPEDLR